MMLKKGQFKITYRRVLVISIIVLMAYPMMGIDWPNFSIIERIKPITIPKEFLNGFVKKEWQGYLEHCFLKHIKNIRSFLVLSYNESKHRMFKTRPNEHYVWTSEMGYYPIDTIRRLNYDVLHQKAIEQHYRRSAKRLKILQSLLKNNGVSLLVVVAPPKARVYPEAVSSYLIAPSKDIIRKAVSYGDILEEDGVNVVNVQKIFRKTKKRSPYPFFTTTSFHWSFWAGCNVAQKIMQKAENITGYQQLKINCSDADYGESKDYDIDIALILNIFSTKTIIGKAPFPKITPLSNKIEEAPKILIIGDSFSDQIVYALIKALPDLKWSPGWLTRYDGFQTRQTFGLGGKVKQNKLLKSEALSEILTKKLLIIEVSDGPIYRNACNLNDMEFGATKILLNEFLKIKNKDIIDQKRILTSGWKALGRNKWYTNSYVANFAIQPKTFKDSLKIKLDVENLSMKNDTTKELDILLDGEKIGQKRIKQGVRGILNITLACNVIAKDSLVAEISLRDVAGQSLNLILHGIQIIGEESYIAAKNLIKTKTSIESKIEKNIDASSINIISTEEPENILVEGLSNLENNENERWRWALGPATHIKFYVNHELSDQSRKMMLCYAFKNGASILDQSVTIQLNGKEIRNFSADEIVDNQLIIANIALNVKKGVNVLDFIYNDWNHGKKIYAPHDPRKLAVVVMQLMLKETTSKQAI